MNPPLIARYQRSIIMLIASSFVLNIAFAGVQMAARQAGTQPDTTTRSIIAGVGIGQLVLAATYLWKMMSAMDRPVVSRVLAMSSQILPLINLIVLVSVNQRATRLLKAAGYRVGFLGARAR